MIFFRPSDPCVHKCELDEDTERCLGCGRRVADMIIWSGLSRKQRHTALAEAKDFLESRNPSP